MWNRNCLHKLDTLFPSTRRIIINKTFTSNYRGRFVNGRCVRRFMNKFNKIVMTRFYRTKDWYHQKQVYGNTEIVILKNWRCLISRLSLISTFYLDDDCFVILNNFSVKIKYLWPEQSFPFPPSAAYPNGKDQV